MEGKGGEMEEEEEEEEGEKEGEEEEGGRVERLSHHRLLPTLSVACISTGQEQEWDQEGS